MNSTDLTCQDQEVAITLACLLEIWADFQVPMGKSVNLTALGARTDTIKAQWRNRKCHAMH
jgi:hypothetical protein